MEILQILSNASLVGLGSLVIGVLPLGFGVAYALWPTDARLALMRPISLAAIFAGLSGSLAGAINVLRGLWMHPTADTHIVAVGAAEALLPMFCAFGCLTIGWLCAAAGLRRHA